MKFEWDPAKARANEGKYGVTFDEASTVFGDALSVSGRDLEHSVGGKSLCNVWFIKSRACIGCLTLTVVASSASSVPAQQLERRNEFMKKANLKDDEMRAEYSRADLGPLVRGKYAARYAKATNIVVIDPALTKAFPNNEAVNDALRSLLAVATAATGTTGRSSRAPRKRVAA
jgi:uncharacterized DUF497 family protein